MAPEREALWRQWDAAGAGATRETLHEQGIGVVYEKDGVVVEEMPDGTVRPVASTLQAV